LPRAKNSVLAISPILPSIMNIRYTYWDLKLEVRNTVCTGVFFVYQKGMLDTGFRNFKT
jgi:hypothetical protein